MQIIKLQFYLMYFLSSSFYLFSLCANIKTDSQTPQNISQTSQTTTTEPSLDFNPAYGTKKKSDPEFAYDYL